jgi:hypothetical protein
LIQKICRPTERCDGKPKKDAVRTGVGKSKGKNWLFAAWICLIGGSMLCRKEKIARGIDHAIKTNFLCNDFKI